MRKIQGKLTIKRKLIIGLISFAGIIIFTFGITIYSAKKTIDTTVEKLSAEQGSLALWLEEDAETYELVFTPVKVAEGISDYFTYVEDAAGTKYMITLPYDYVFSAANSGIEVGHDDCYTDQAVNTSAYQIKKYLKENHEGNCCPIKCTVYKSDLHFVFTEDGMEEQIDDAIAIREFLGDCE